MSGDISRDVDAGVATILLNRPARRNAFTFDMLDQWAEYLRSVRRDPAVRVVVIRGAGGAFCSGVDLDEFTAARSTPLADKLVLTDRVHQVAEAAELLGKPLIAAVDGVAIGAGMDMALLADIRLVSRRARFSQGYIKVGLVPGDGGCYLLPRVVGMARALELMWTGDVIDGTEAERIGLANHVYDDAAFDDEVAAFARRIALAPPIAVSVIKRAAQQGASLSLRGALDQISSHQAVVQSTRDSAEAMAAFRERRPAQFHGD
jgi:enoyl-CoA hydratase/carnithine racemase